LITIATLLWDKNAKSRSFSQMYDEKWVTRLYDGCARNLSQPFRFVLFTDRARDLPAYIEQERMKELKPSYADCIEPFRLGVPMILMGLDTVITGSIDHLAHYCLRDDVNLALPRDPNDRTRSCNGVVLTPAGQQRIYENWAGENDMDWLRAQRHDFIDDLFPGQVVSYKGDVKKNGLGDARIVYFHGQEKPHQLLSEPWIKEHWLGG
jgi:hypothetical protein